MVAVISLKLKVNMLTAPESAGRSGHYTSVTHARCWLCRGRSSSWRAGFRPIHNSIWGQRARWRRVGKTYRGAVLSP